MRQNFIKKQLIIALVLSSLLCTAKNKRQDSCAIKRFRPSNETSLFLLTAGYRLPVNRPVIINSGHGFYVEAGINAARFFSHKTILGVYGGWGMMDRLWATSFNSAFITDYQAAYNREAGLNSLDSAVATSFGSVMADNRGRSSTPPGCGMKSFHNYSLYYGIVLKLPYRFCPVLKIYSGFNRSHFQGSGDIITSKKDFNIFQLRRSLCGVELVLFRGWQGVSDRHSKFPSHLNTGTLSVYYESCDMSGSSLYFSDGDKSTNIPLKRITSSGFLSKYRRETYLGVKLAFSIL